MQEIMARGPNFVYAKEFIQNEYGDRIWKQVLERLPEDVAEIWYRGTFISGLYPFNVFKVTVFTLSKVLGAPEDTEIAKMYEYIADRSLNIVYKMFFKVTSPSFVIGNYPMLWDRFFTVGKVEVPLVEEGHAKVKFILPEIFLDWLPPACLGYTATLHYGRTSKYLAGVVP
jgi:hypothetical protein